MFGSTLTQRSTPPLRPNPSHGGQASPRALLGGFQPRVCAVLFRDSKQNQIHQPARPYNVGGRGSPSIWRVPPDLSPHAQVPDASKHRGVDCPTLGLTGVHVKGVAPRSRPPVPGLSVAPGLRPLTPRGPSVAPGPRPPVLWGIQLGVAFPGRAGGGIQLGMARLESTPPSLSRQ